jgi:predicted Fe-Mo cluster-binding NifX family protein
LIALGWSGAASAAVTTTAIREAVEFITKKFSREAAQEGTELLTKKLEQAAAKYGDDAVNAARKVGPQALKAIDDAGQFGATAAKAMARHGDEAVAAVVRSPKALEMAAKYGDDAVDVMVKHKGVAVELIQESGESAVKALKNLGDDGATMLANMAGQSTTRALVQNPKVLDVVARYGDRAMNFIWRNKGALAVGAGLAAFLADPEPFINGTRDLAAVVGENVVKPVVDRAAAGIDWMVVAIGVMVIGGLLLVMRSYLRHRVELRRAAAGAR